MMYISEQHGKNCRGDAVYEQHGWHIGETLPCEADNVISVQADGDELEVILNTIVGIPHVNYDQTRRVQTWYGDHAKFIVGNL